MTNRNPLVDPAWLAARLSGPDILPLDCRVTRIPQPSGASLWPSGRADWEAGHIPGAGYAHMVEDLSDPDHPVPFMLPPPARIAAFLAQFGVRPATTITVYGEGADMAAHRAWWVLTASGCADVRVLDGGLSRWRAEGRPLATGVETFAAAPPLDLTPVPGMVADRADVRRAIGDPSSCLANALPEALFRGEGDQVYGRRGRIAGSVSLPTGRLIDPDSGCFRPVEDLRSLFAERLPAGTTRVIPYCGGGIAASTLALALTAAGHSGIQLYDGSLMDWAQDPDAPMETG